MASVYVANRRQKNSPVWSRAIEGNKLMTELSPESTAATKVIAKACRWYDRRQAVQGAPREQKAREFGRYEQSGHELAEAVEKYRNAKAGQP